MYMVTMRLAPPASVAWTDVREVRAAVFASTLPSDQVEHVYAQAGRGRTVDVVILFSSSDLHSAQVSSTALNSRLLHDYLPGWRLEETHLGPLRVRTE